MRMKCGKTFLISAACTTAAKCQKRVKFITKTASLLNAGRPKLILCSAPKLIGIHTLLLQFFELLHNNGLIVLMRYAEPSVVRGLNMHPHLARLYCAANGNGQQILVLHGVLFKAGGYVGAEIIVQNIEYAV